MGHRRNIRNHTVRIYLVTVCMISAACPVHAQELEPRAYSNAPVGLNFLLAGYQYSSGALIFDASLPVTDADSQVNTGLLGYIRVINLAGKSAKAGVLMPYASLSADGYLSGVYHRRDTIGLADPSFFLSVNLYGAPALSASEFRNYRQETIVGLTFKVTAPLGEYDSDKIINLGTNRWSFEPEIGISRAVGRWTLESAASAYLYSDNDNFDNGNTRRQSPIYSVQVNVIYSFKNDVWASVGSTFYTGGETSINGIDKNDKLDNTRTGFTVALPVNRNQSVKLFGSTGISTRTGSDYDSLGIAWQYRWGAGL